MQVFVNIKAYVYKNMTASIL